MKGILDGSEPVVNVGMLTALVGAIITLLAAFGLPLTDAQSEAIMGLDAIVAPVAMAFIARRHVTPTIKLLGSTNAVRPKRVD